MVFHNWIKISLDPDKLVGRTGLGTRTRSNVFFFTKYSRFLINLKYHTQFTCIKDASGLTVSFINKKNVFTFFTFKLD